MKRWYERKREREGGKLWATSGKTDGCDGSSYFQKNMRNFKQLLIWQKGFEIAVTSFKLVQDFPKKERFALSNQITRAAVSIPSNIAEGSSRTSERDYNRFLEISLGSSCELETQLLIANAAGFGNADLCGKMLSDVEQEQRMMTGFMTKLAK